MEIESIDIPEFESDFQSPGSEYETTRYYSPSSNSAVQLESRTVTEQRSSIQADYQTENEHEAHSDSRENDSQKDFYINDTDNEDNTIWSFDDVQSPIRLPATVVNLFFCSDSEKSESARTSHSTSSLTDLFDMQREQAFNEWLVAKRSSGALKRRNHITHKKELQAAQSERKKNAEKSFNEWLIKKKNQIKSKAVVSNTIKPNALPVETLAKNCNFEVWLKKKNSNAMIEKQQKAIEAKVKALDDQIRKQTSTQKVNKWLLESNTRSKPVPPNQGLLSLRGCLSLHYVNPNKWTTE